MILKQSYKPRYNNIILKYHNFYNDLRIKKDEWERGDLNPRPISCP